MPLMWPGVITTGLFSFLLAYNDYLVAALLLDGQSQTMIPAIIQYFNMETTMTDLVEAIAAAASITAPLFLLVLFFQKQIISGLTTGAVKGWFMYLQKFEVKNITANASSIITESSLVIHGGWSTK